MPPPLFYAINRDIMFTRLSQLPSTYATRRRPKQSGVVLIIALIMLVVISLMAAMSVRNATSSEAVNANVRQTQSASQAAETALRYCEDATINMVNSGTGTSTATFTLASSSSTITFDINSIVYSGTSTIALGTPISTVAANWDSTSSSYKILVLPASMVNRSGISSTFSRAPECMVEHIEPSASPMYGKRLTVTTRGFGPEVSAADSTRSRPIGSEVWLQSSLEFN